MRLKTAQIGYNFPKKWLNPAGIEGLRLYVEGYNLLTFSGLTKYNIDPGITGGEQWLLSATENIYARCKTNILKNGSI